MNNYGEMNVSKKFGQLLLVSVIWLFIGGLSALYLGANQAPWLIGPPLMLVIGVVGVHLAFTGPRDK